MRIEGLKELSDKLVQMDKKMGLKTLRQAVMSASLPAFREAKLRAPIGEEPHRTFKGNLVSPGFTSRNIKRRSKVDRRRGTATVAIGPINEAFYATQFVELGTKYIEEYPWLTSAFESKESAMTDRLRDVLRKKILQAAQKK